MCVRIKKKEFIMSKLILSLLCLVVMNCCVAEIYQPQSRIINGQIDTLNQFPWHVHIQVSYQNTTIINNCGGSIITNQYILTAADCVINAKTIKINFGSTVLSKPAKTLFATVFYVHPYYNSVYFVHNTALVKLPQTIGFTQTTNAIRLPSRSQINQLFVNQEAYFTGFGFTSTKNNSMSDRLRWVKERIVSNADCSKNYHTQMTQASAICAVGWDNPWQNACFGDGGGALVINEFGVWTQIGVMSFIHPNGCDSGFPVGFTRLTTEFDWITKVTGYAFRP